MLQDNFTPLLTHHHSVISNLSSFLNTASGGVPTNKFDTDDDSTGSTNTDSTGSLSELAINQLHVN